MVVIDLCIFKALICNTLVPHTKKYPHLLCPVAHEMLSDNSKKYAAVTAIHSKQIIDMLEK